MLGSLRTTQTLTSSCQCKTFYFSYRHPHPSLNQNGLKQRKLFLRMLRELLEIVFARAHSESTTIMSPASSSKYYLNGPCHQSKPSCTAISPFMQIYPGKSLQGIRECPQCPIAAATNFCGSSQSTVLF